ncbi:hypothetical protein C9374_009365 [Naegleria lovaniensis]|uniref:F-box domain-containing protein n=1 Tax=Naegleria lovaniensis TaxID=51637 RepID=A0AA88GDK9_NAELO|nr:uncharacterized protein C9374_009365 [Naegleria lovaniensis]KAG2377454.1 hypothetical protein C9374_009365 [Naegleria lovaniensis]
MKPEVHSLPEDPPNYYISLSDIAHPSIVQSYLNLDRIMEEIHGSWFVGDCTKFRLASYLHQIMLFLLMKSEPLIKLRNENFRKVMHEYAVQRVIEMDEKYVRMLVLENQYSSETPNDKEPISKNQVLMTSPNFEAMTSSRQYFNILIDHFFPGELSTFAKQEAHKLTQSSTGVTHLQKFLNHYFTSSEFGDINGELDEAFCCSLLLLLEYLSAEVLELALNQTKTIQSNIITLANVAKGIEQDEELRSLMHLRAIGYLSTAFESLDDFTCYYDDATGGAPPLTMKADVEQKEEAETLVIEEPSLKKRKLEEDFNNFSQLPPELHEEIVKHFYPLPKLLDKRLVCKRWNYYIVRNAEIWKYLCAHTLQEENIFASNFKNMTLHEIFSSISSYPFYSSPFGHFVQIHDLRNFLEIYNLKVRFHMQLFQDLTSPKLFQGEETCNLCDSIIRSMQKNITFGVTSCCVSNYEFPYDNKALFAETKLFGLPYVPQQFETPENHFFLGQINCEQLKSKGLISLNRNMPLKGMLYFFTSCNACKVFYNEEIGDWTPLQPLRPYVPVPWTYRLTNICDSMLILNDNACRKSLTPMLEYFDDACPIASIPNVLSIRKQNAVVIGLTVNDATKSTNDVILWRSRHKIQNVIVTIMISEEDLKLRSFDKCWMMEEKDLQDIEEEKVDPSYGNE